MNHKIPELDARGLRNFALTFAGVVAGLFGLILPLVIGARISWIPWVIALVVALWGLSAPSSVRPFYRLWMQFGRVMGMITSRVVLSIVFYLLVLPFSLVLRARGKDPLRRRWDHSAKSYRVNSENPDPSHMERPF